MTIIYIAHAIQVVNKKRGGYSVKQVIYNSYTNPSNAHQEACDIIVQILKKENYFTEKTKTKKSKDDDSGDALEQSSASGKGNGKSEYERRKERVNDIVSNQDPPAGKYYDLDDILSKWSPDIPELDTKKYDVHVSESDLK